MSRPKTFLAGISSIAIIILLSVTFSSNVAFADHCKGKHRNDPGCDGGTEPPPDPGGSADPQLIYRDGGFYLANADGTSQTKIWRDDVEPFLDAPRQRVLFLGRPSTGLNYLGLLPYSNDLGNIVVGNEQMLLNTADISTLTISGKFSGFGLTDWSQGGDKYAYTIRQDYGDGLGWRHKIMVSPSPDGTSSTTFDEHTVAWDGAPEGGQGPAAWDASGDYIYVFEEFNLNLPQILLVIDITTDPGVVVATADLTDLIGATGFARESNPQGLSASYAIGGSTGGYSFDPDNLTTFPRNPNTSLCLMIPLVDWGWSQRHEARFTMIFDLPALFDPESGVSCPLTTASTATILDFQGADFTTGDTGMVGRDHRKNRTIGVWIYDMSSGSRTQVVGDGGFPDWSN